MTPPSLRQNSQAIKEAIVPLSDAEKAQIEKDNARDNFWSQIRVELQTQASLASTSVRLPAKSSTTFTDEERAMMEAQWQQRKVHSQEITRQKYEAVVQSLIEDGIQPSTRQNAFKAVLERARELCQPRAYATTVKIIVKKFDCKVCKDAGLLRVEGPDPTKPAQRIPCRHCYVLRKRKSLIKNLLKERRELATSWPEQPELMALGSSSFVADYAKMLRHVSKTQQNQITQKLRFALRVTKRYCQVWPQGAWLQYDGVCGAGKTHFLAMIYKAAQKAKKTVIYVTAPEIESRLINFSGQNANEKILAFVRQLIAAEVLLIDEAEKYTRKNGTGWVERKFFHILDTRCKMARTEIGKFHTILAGNALKASLPPEIKSRASGAGSCYIELFGVPDGRPIFEGSSAWQKGLRT